MKVQSGNPKESEALAVEPRWPAMLAVLAVGGLYAALPETLRFGPYWWPLAAIVILVIPAIVSRRAGRHDLNQALGYVLLAVLTGAMIASLAALIATLPSHRESPLVLLRAATALWTTNVLVFASWYYRVDGGGPNQRDRVARHTDGAFLFPQMTMRASQDRAWRPNFVDYLFLAFNTSAAFSPTDTPVLSRWAKLMMIVQSGISLTTVAILAARAINIL